MNYDLPTILNSGLTLTLIMAILIGIVLILIKMDLKEKSEDSKRDQD